MPPTCIDRRLGILGELPDERGSRGLFGRGMARRLARPGAGRIQGARDGRAVESWFFPAAGDDPYADIHVRDDVAPDTVPGTEVTVPLASERLPAEGRLRALVAQLVQLRPVLEDPARAVARAALRRQVGVRPRPSPMRSGRCRRPERGRGDGGDPRSRSWSGAAGGTAGWHVAGHPHRRVGGRRPRGSRVDVRLLRGLAGNAQPVVRRGALRRARRPSARRAERPAPGRCPGRSQRAGTRTIRSSRRSSRRSIESCARSWRPRNGRRVHIPTPGSAFAVARSGRPARAQRRAEERLRHARQGGLPGRRRAELARADRVQRAALRRSPRRRSGGRSRRRAPRCASSSR